MSTLEKMFVAVAGLLLAVGLLMVYSASITSRPTEFEEVYLSRQILFLGIAVTTGASCAGLPSRYWKQLAPWLFAGTVLLLALVLIPSVGVSVKGARRWLRIGSISLQPSELAKVTLPLLLCSLTADGGWQHAARWRSTLLATVPVGVALGLVVIEPDLGTAVFLTLTAALALFLSGWPLRWFVLAAVVAMPAAGLLALRPYQWARVQGFLAGWSNFSAAPYQVRQSLTALGAGGWAGTGLGDGQQKLSFLPEANTDFVFAVIGEELGLVGTCGVLLLWSALFTFGIRLLSPLRRGSFEFAAGLTLLTGLVLQSAINIAVVLAVVPPKGISLPLISYGGSNLLVSVMSLGMVVSLSRSAEVQPHSAGSAPPTASRTDGSLARNAAI